MAQAQADAPALTPGFALGLVQPVVQPLKGDDQTWPDDPENVPISSWDSGVFITELANLNLLPTKFNIATFTVNQKNEMQANPESLLLKAEETAPRRIEQGTYRGTALAMTKVYEMIETEYDASHWVLSLADGIQVQILHGCFEF